MRSTLAQDKHAAFVLTETDARKLWEIIQSEGESCVAQADLSDDTTITFTTLDQLIAFPNADSRQINALHLRNRSESDIAIRISFHRSPRFQPPIKLSIEAEDDTLLRIRRNLSEQIMSLKPAYSWWAVYGRLVLMVAAAILGGAVLFIVARRDPTGHLTIDSSIFVVGTALAMVVLMGFSQPASRWLFPLGVFALGAGEKRNASYKARRNIVLVVIGLGALVSLLSAIGLAHL